MPCSSPSFFAASSKRASAFWYTFISSGTVPCDIPNAPLPAEKHGSATPLYTPKPNYSCSFFLRLACDTQKIGGLPTRKRATRPGAPVYESFPHARKFRFAQLAKHAPRELPLGKLPQRFSRHRNRIRSEQLSILE